MTVEQRLWNRIDKKSADECWLWCGSINSRGYGQISIQGNLQLVHRVVWELKYKKPVPAGLLVCHTCDTRRCCNPIHLFLGTPADNMTDKAKKGRASCLRGKDNPRAKLTESEVREIRRRLSAGEYGTSLALEFNVNSTSIYYIKNHRRWNSVT